MDTWNTTLVQKKMIILGRTCRKTFNSLKNFQPVSAGGNREQAGNAELWLWWLLELHVQNLVVSPSQPVVPSSARATALNMPSAGPVVHS